MVVFSFARRSTTVPEYDAPSIGYVDGLGDNVEVGETAADVTLT